MPARMMSAVSRRTALLAANTPVTPLKPKTMPPMDEYGHAVSLPRGGPHDLVLQQNLPSRDVTGFETAPLCQSVSSIQACSGGAYEPTDALIFSGCTEFDLGSMHPLVALMPEVMFVGTLLERYPEILPMLEAMEREARGEHAGFAGILARLADRNRRAPSRLWITRCLQSGVQAGNGTSAWRCSRHCQRSTRLICVARMPHRLKRLLERLDQGSGQEICAFTPREKPWPCCRQPVSSDMRTPCDSRSGSGPLRACLEPA
jgi:hypothetical protein